MQDINIKNLLGVTENVVVTLDMSSMTELQFRENELIKEFDLVRQEYLSELQELRSKYSEKFSHLLLSIDNIRESQNNM